MTALNLLNRYKLSKTESRLTILNILLSSGTALSEIELQSMLNGICDRATIYRTLKKFREHGLIHPITLENSALKYIITRESNEHIHFKCTGCGELFCLSEIPQKYFTLPDGFVKKECSLVVTGICRHCNN
jgi:Fur family ferric uptake transcriptional regulator